MKPTTIATSPTGNANRAYCRIVSFGFFATMMFVILPGTSIPPLIISHNSKWVHSLLVLLQLLQEYEFHGKGYLKNWIKNWFEIKLN
jgi:hypothetical protein